MSCIRSLPADKSSPRSNLLQIRSNPRADSWRRLIFDPKGCLCMATETLEARPAPEAVERTPEQLLMELQSINLPKTLPGIQVTQVKRNDNMITWKKVRSLLYPARTSSRQSTRITTTGSLQRADSAAPSPHANTSTQNRTAPSVELAQFSRVRHLKSCL